MLKCVILIGGPQKGTRFRPLSLDCPKPLFPVAGLPLIQHHIEATVSMSLVKEILIIGYYPHHQLEQFVVDMQHLYKINIRYLQEFTALGTAGGMYHFRDQIRSGNPEAFFVMNGDVCADFPLKDLYEFHKSKPNKPLVTIMGTEATRQQSLNYGCIVIEKETHQVSHYVEKPKSYVSTLINCGVYVCSLDVFQKMAQVFNSRQLDCSGHLNGNGRVAEHIQFEEDILAPLAGSQSIYALQVTSWWSQLKTAGAAIYANRHYLQLYRTKKPERLASLPSGSDAKPICTIIPDVYIHPSATIHPTALLGPNVSVGSGVVVGSGVRIRESILLDEATIDSHSLILHSIIGKRSHVGEWTRVEGTPSDPDPNKPFAKMENPSLFNCDGRLNPSITILGSNVCVPSETILLNSIVLPHKELTRSFKNEIIL